MSADLSDAYMHWRVDPRECLFCYTVPVPVLVFRAESDPSVMELTVGGGEDASSFAAGAMVLIPGVCRQDKLVLLLV